MGTQNQQQEVNEEGSVAKRSKVAAAGSATASVVTIDLDILDCPVCFHPRRPPVFQCAIGHAICSSCHDKLVDKDKCGACKSTGGYNLCIVLEHILQSVRVRCSNSIYGCISETRYHEREEHEKSCPRAPCFCPEAGCDFAGSTALLLRHLTAEHKWPSTEFEYGQQVQVQEGMQVLHCKDSGPLFLVKFTAAPPLINIASASVSCVDPRAAAEGACKFKCHIGFDCPAIDWHQSADFQIRSTTLSDGLPSPTEGCYPFVVPHVCNPPTTSRITVSITKIISFSESMVRLFHDIDDL